LKLIKQSKKNPELLVVTPLFTGHKISKETKINLLRNDIDFTWISYESGGNTAENFSDGIKAYRKKFTDPKYVMMVDRDIIPSRHMLDSMYETIRKTDDNIAFCYCNFEFSGAVNQRFHNIPYDPMRLIQGNYISSNSMIKLDKLDDIGGVVTDNKYKRLLDWALWLQFLTYGYYGVLCHKTSFIAISEPSSVSSGTAIDYNIKKSLIKQDFIEPLLGGIVF
jgi:hypothetical protein